MEIVSFEIAKKLKEKGFPQRPDYFNYSSYYDWDGLRKIHSLSNASVWFDPNISRDNIYFAPTISQVLKWMREEKRIEAGAVWDNRDGKWVGYVNEMDMPDLVGEYVLPNNTYDSYELAALAGVEYVIDNLI